MMVFNSGLVVVPASIPRGIRSLPGARPVNRGPSVRPPPVTIHLPPMQSPRLREREDSPRPAMSLGPIVAPRGYTTAACCPQRPSSGHGLGGAFCEDYVACTASPALPVCSTALKLAGQHSGIGTPSLSLCCMCIKYGGPAPFLACGCSPGSSIITLPPHRLSSASRALNVHGGAMPAGVLSCNRRRPWSLRATAIRGVCWLPQVLCWYFGCLAAGSPGVPTLTEVPHRPALPRTRSGILKLSEPQ
ncbi:hypothetical protein NDU88_006030 [Pleurodeles waltl]|uniref:Uncharacterized protein n=1 Tax=Pleurodeles waltl TaxID=8319 RepID=A0AAV7NS33_PLEWA|nr:hypothetical protein NDU88_006030 [Pleurodeles waltl]